MNCINEILSKKFIPTEYESFLFQMFQQTFKLLQIMTSSSTTAIDERYFMFVFNTLSHNNSCFDDDANSEHSQKHLFHFFCSFELFENLNLDRSNENNEDLRLLTDLVIMIKIK